MKQFKMFKNFPQADCMHPNIFTSFGKCKICFAQETFHLNDILLKRKIRNKVCDNRNDKTHENLSSHFSFPHEKEFLFLK